MLWEKIQEIDAHHIAHNNQTQTKSGDCLGIQKRGQEIINLIENGWDQVEKIKTLTHQPRVLGEAGEIEICEDLNLEICSQGPQQEITSTGTKNMIIKVEISKEETQILKQEESLEEIQLMIQIKIDGVVVEMK